MGKKCKQKKWIQE